MIKPSDRSVFPGYEDLCNNAHVHDAVPTIQLKKCDLLATHDHMHAPGTFAPERMLHATVAVSLASAEAIYVRIRARSFPLRCAVWPTAAGPTETGADTFSVIIPRCVPCSCGVRRDRGHPCFTLWG